MRLALLLFKYFPHGGLQRNFRRITELCLAHGHEVDVFTLAWEGWDPSHPALRIERVEVGGWRNHVRYRRFAEALEPRLRQGGYDRIVGFNKLPGLDVYYNADPCLMHRAMHRGWLYRRSARFKQLAAFEQAVFAANTRNHILLLSPAEQPLFQHWYNTRPDRFRPMPPYVSPDRFAPADYPERRRRMRQDLGLADDQRLLLMVGSDYRRKGVDRAVRALAALPDAKRQRSQLYVLGKGQPGPIRRLASRLGLAEQVHLLQGRDDVPDFLFAADLLLHVAYQENTGTAIVEAIAAGLPALVTGNCGYAAHVSAAECGQVIAEPFRQETLDRALSEMLDSKQRDAWRANALAYAAETELGNRAEHAVRVIEGPKYGEVAE
ncbi:glycosyltransferase family 4 protein [Methylonatrum kenyense]|uniref:glycosyltransferase family 4 protein n=1 Tax=Methylonatrum kenyense TaxID=455253 RepID=UPI0020C187DA|nr:glycosyltransferase family 4 protein [Methylonatrum kenyense]MCK8517005.1 glycosyltransferase family 4 protein [Methylonatrum kenyense]